MHIAQSMCFFLSEGRTKETNPDPTLPETNGSHLPGSAFPLKGVGDRLPPPKLNIELENDGFQKGFASLAFNNLCCFSRPGTPTGNSPLGYLGFSHRAGGWFGGERMATLRLLKS